MQDLVEELSKEKTWYTPRKLSQQAYERNADGSFAGYEEEVCSSYNWYYTVYQWSVTRSCDMCHTLNSTLVQHCKREVCCTCLAEGGLPYC